MTQLVARYAARRAHVLTVEVPGYWVVRAEAERRLGARGWRVATAPADADVVAVCGAPGPELTRAVDRVWDQLPGPRVLVELADPGHVESVLDRAYVELLNTDKHRSDARHRAQTPIPRGDDSLTQPDDRPAMDPDAKGGSPANHGGHGPMEHGTMNHGGRDRGDINHDAHTDHDAINHHEHGHSDHDAMDHGEHGHHGAMDMAPAGIALAGGGEDRDGLEMDVLQVRLGPILGNWPAGLVLCCALQGDVLTEADAWVVDGDLAYDGARLRGRNEQVLAAARQCDHANDLLMMAGWPRAAATARRARDALVSEPSLDRGRSLLDRLHRALCRSRMLRWSLRDIAPLTVEDCGRLELPVALAGDCYDRLLTRVGAARHMLEDPLQGNQFRVASPTVVDALPGLVGGLDLATARLAVASLGIDTAPEHAGGRDG